MFKMLFMVIVYVLCGGVLGSIVGRITIQFTDENTFMMCFTMLVCVVSGIIIVSKTNRANNITILFSIVCGAVIGFVLSRFSAIALEKIVYFLNINVYINPADILSFGVVYGAVFWVLLGIFSFVLVSFDFNVKTKEIKVESNK